jgi:pimeloyl-ACP methyl ester carboxylesterase
MRTTHQEANMQDTAAMEASTTRSRTTSTHATVSVASTVRSKDGTAIAFDRIGHGAPVILVDGGLCYRRMGRSPQLAELLAPYFTVITYDRRGRGESGDTSPYAVEREVEDIAALLSEAGGSAYIWAMSSGAMLALEAATRLGGIEKLALYEPPLIVDDSRPAMQEMWIRIGEAVTAHRPGAAVKCFLQGVGVPNVFIALMRLMPMWSKLEAIAHTLPYDGAIVRDYQRGQPLPAGRWASVTVPTLVMDGGKSPRWVRNGNRALAHVLPNAQYRTLDKQTHMLKPKAHAPTLVEFFKG